MRKYPMRIYSVLQTVWDPEAIVQMASLASPGIRASWEVDH